MFEMYSARRMRRVRGPRRESARLSSRGNYCTVPSPVTRGLEGVGRFKGRPGGTGGMRWEAAQKKEGLV